ncbi:MAG TPA: heavy metal sensor histidine kinase [Gemmataceae bacterium]|nr:heavy metal sensor histidine kinase [Gemmataceae bacterium]
MRLSIRWKLTMWYGGVLALVLVAFSAAIFLVLRYEGLERIDEGLNEELTDVLFEINRASDAKGLMEWFQRRFFQHEGFDFQITDAKGKRFFASARLANAALPLPSTQSKSVSHESATVDTRGRWRIVNVQVEGPDGLLTVQVARSLAAFDHEMGELLLTLCLTGAATLVVAIGGGYFLARRALRPVQHMTRAANQISADQLHKRIEVDNPADELGALGQTLNRMIERLERSFTEIRLFTADASHELRTPLTAIRTEAEVALGKLPDKEHQQILGSILEECDRLTRLTDQLLTLSREDAGVSKQVCEPVDLAALVRGVVDTMRLLAETKGLRLDLEEHGPIEIDGDPARLRQVFYNVIDNAIKYTPEGGSIEVRMESLSRESRVSVADTGIGIPPEHLARVFDRFYRVDKARSRDQGGTGLGLTIARSIVVAHGGKFELKSTLGQGTTCTLVLPLNREYQGNSRQDQEVAR